MSDVMTPRSWLLETPLQNDEQLYAVFSSTSDADPLTVYRQLSGTDVPVALWDKTPYASWTPVMPYLVAIAPNSPFLDWVAEVDAQDWGWLAVSCQPMAIIAEHLRSLTQVFMPSGEAVFFRFWDGRYIYPIVHGLGKTAGELMPMFGRYLINGRSLEVGTREVPKVRDWPWWEAPQALLDSLVEDDPTTLIDNIMQWLEDERPDIYNIWPESNLKLKITRFVRASNAPKNLKQALLNHLAQEQG
ncbi:hypothetical protein PS880_04962 [Pseudomonas fluorescens]|uniref:DUF4123 domain-containing protein n=2 Tax=Pseudomonas fluorescens TaxID=294 RepID=A0A5E7P2M8_PSEFL|nr:hypothetical protein PS880_04962 [Pseudomonas fluorescens]